MGAVVLNVEDNSDDVLLLKRACERAQVGFRLQFVDDGEKAIDYLRGDKEFSDRAQYPKPDLILLDLNMPRKTGLEVLEWMKAKGVLASIPVAIFTSSANQNDIAAALREGADCYLTKPMSYEALLRIVKDLNGILAKPDGAVRESLRRLPRAGVQS
jgi:CheY-like chemotaxis protein